MRVKSPLILNGNQTRMRQIDDLFATTDQISVVEISIVTINSNYYSVYSELNFAHRQPTSKALYLYLPETNLYMYSKDCVHLTLKD
jgi:hypothetical protein